MRTAIVNNGSRYLPELTRLLMPYLPTVIPRRKIRNIVRDEYDAVVLSGGRGFSVSGHPDHFAEEIEFIQSYEGAVIGVCLGAQLIGAAYGQTLYRLPTRRFSEQEIELIETHQKIVVKESHRWVLPEVEGELHCLAVSEDGCEMFVHRTKPRLGVQFHPEISSVEVQKMFLHQVESVVQQYVNDIIGRRSPCAARE